MKKTARRQGGPKVDGACGQVASGEGRIAANIVNFAKEHNLHIHPGQSPVKWAGLVIKKSGCPCVPGRKVCPCDAAMDDIDELGHCRCYLFCNDEYLELYNKLMPQGKAKKKR